MSDYSRDQILDFYFLLTNLGMDYESYKRLSIDQRKNLIHDIKSSNAAKFRKEKIKFLVDKF